MIRVGADYYPEHWDRELWAKDIALMKETGVTTIRIAEFMWGMLEPEEGVFDFSLLDDFIRDADEAGLELVLCTPTACPPNWMYKKYPDIIQMDRTGHRIATGIRGHRCIESPRFRAYASRMIEEMTKRYADDPHVIGWQIDNELESNHCTCPECTEHFRRWLQKKYASLEEMNKAWGTDIWSGQITDWDQIQGPLGQDYNLGWLNPGYMLDFERHAADSVVGFIRFQIEELRKRVPANVPITTNTYLARYSVDFMKSFAETDIAAYDNYPPTTFPEDPEEIVTNTAILNLTRGTKRKNFWIMEQLSGPFGCWGDMQPTPRPGMLEGYGLQSVAHGADMVLYWRWRAAIKGAETFCQGLIGHDNVPDRRFKEFANVCRRLHAIGDELDGTTVKSSVAILYGADQMNAIRNQPQSTGFDYWNEIKKWQYAYRSMGIDADIIDQEANLEGYKVVVVPAHFVTDQVTVENVSSFAKNGGTVIVTCRSGVKDPHNAAIMQPLPTAFGEMCGIEISEYDPLGKRDMPINMDEKRYEASLWCDMIREPKTAKVIATYGAQFYAGTPAITKNEFGEGHVYYVGTCGKKALLKKLAEMTLEEQQVPAVAGLPEGIDLVTRENEDGSKKFHFLFNESETANEVHYGDQVYSLKPFEIKIIKETKISKETEEKKYEIF